MDSSAACRGCRDDFYNHPGPHGSKQCWLLEKAEMVTRWRIHWWTSPVTPRAFTEVRVPSCYHQPGKFAYSKALPEHAVEPVRLKAPGA